MRNLAPVLAVLTFSTLASAQVRSVGPVSFVVPDGMTYAEEGDHATMTKVVGQSFVAIAISTPVPSVGDAEANFRSVWTRITQTQPPLINYNLSPTGGYGGRYMSQSCKPNVNCILFTLETPKGVVPIFVFIPNKQPDWSFFYPFHQSVRVSPLKAQPPKKNLTLADLVGKWKWGAASTMAYVGSSGTVLGTSTNAASSVYTIAADGSYTVASQGINGSTTFRQAGSGSVELTPDAVVFHEKGHDDRRYRFITLVETVDGSTLLTFLSAVYEATDSNISAYAEKFVRL